MPPVQLREPVGVRYADGAGVTWEHRDLDVTFHCFARELGIPVPKVQDWIAQMDQRASFRDPGSAPSLALEELIDALVRDVEQLQQELDELVSGIQAADSDDPAATMAYEVRLEGLTQARSLMARALQVAQRTNRAARQADPPLSVPPPPRPVREAEPSYLSPGPALARHPYELDPPEPLTPPAPSREAPPTFNRSMKPLELSVLPPDGDFQRYQIEGPLTFAAMLALKEAVASLHGVRSVRVAPRPEGATVLMLISQDPDATLRDLQQVPNFVMRLVVA
jgi:hypothetical protein